MGLDSIEYVMEVEEEFGVSVPDNVAQRLRTIGDFVDHILSQGAMGTRELVLDKLREITSKHSGVPLERIGEGSRFIEDLGFD